MRLTSKPQARRPATTGSRRPVGLTGTSGGAGDDLLTFLQLAAHHFGRRTVRDAEPHRDGLGLAVGTDDPEPARRRAAPTFASGKLVVLRLLLRREDLANAHAHSLADALAFALALLLREPGAPQRDHLLAHVVEDRIDLRLLVGGEIERLDESLAHLLRAAGAATLATTTGWSAAARRRPAARMTARWRRVTGFAGGAEAKRGVGDLQHVGLLGDDELDVGGHAREKLAIRIRDGDDDRVGDDVLDDLPRLADLHHLAAKCLVRERVHREGVRAVEVNPADVGLVHARL